MPNLKQGTLSFPSTKRTNSISNAKSQKKSLVTEKNKIKQAETLVESTSDAKNSEVVEIFSDEEETVAAEISVPAKRTRATTDRSSSRPTKRGPTDSQPSQFEKQKPFPVETERNHLDVEDKARRYRKYYNEVRSKMGYIPPIHAEGQNKIHQMLRFFDMSYEFGPCIGMTRLERWERAEAFGLNPPVEVREILLTKEGVEKAEYVRCVLDNEV